MCLSWLRFGEKIGSRDNRHVEMLVGAIFEKCFLEGGVREVGAILSEEVVDSMDDGEGQVGSVQLRFGRSCRSWTMD